MSWNDEKAAVAKLLEPMPDVETSQLMDRVQLSTAISLKRIADAFNEPNRYGEVGSEAIANSIARGIAGTER